MELTRIFKENILTDCEREKKVQRQRREIEMQRETTDDGVDAETSLSLSLFLHFYLSSPPLHFFLALTISQYILFENNEYLEDSLANRRDLQFSAAPAL